MSSRRLVVAFALATLAAAPIAGCKSRPTEKPRQGTLAERVEGQEGLNRVVAALAAALPKNEVVGAKFAATDWASFKERMAAYLCHAVGGPCPFEGTQRDALGVALGDDDFTAFMEVFIAAMNEADLPQKEQNDLIDVMMRDRAAQAEGAAPAPAAPVAPAPPAAQ